MATTTSKARMSIVQDTAQENGASTADSSQSFHQRFLFVGEDSLQMKMLMSLISSKFNKPSSISSLSELDLSALNHTEDTLVVLDCYSIEETGLIGLVEELAPARKPGLVLINTDENTPLMKLAEWPHVVGIFQSNAELDIVLTGFDQVLKGGLWLPRDVMEVLLLNGARQTTGKRNRPMPVNLTKRETQILEKLAEGVTNTSIADSLFLSEHTVKTHLYNIYKKVNVRNRTQACNWLKQYQGD